MALNTLKCNHLMPLPFKGLILTVCGSKCCFAYTWLLKYIYAGASNITSCAEFNFYQDPEAANVVLSELGCRITMIPWELCLEYSLPWVGYNSLLGTFSTRRLRKMRLITRRAALKIID